MTSSMTADGGHVTSGTGSVAEIAKKSGSVEEAEDLRKKLKKLTEENEELAEEVDALAREVCRLRREKDLSLREEERLTLEIAFLEEEKEYYQNQVEDTRKVLFDLKDELEKAIAESTKYKSHLVVSELERCEEVDGYLEEIAQLTDDKSHVARMIKYGLPLKLGNLRHSLVRTEEFLTQKAENKRLRSELTTATGKLLSQDAYISDLERSVHELSQMLCRFQPVPTPSAMMLAAAAATASGSAASVCDAIADNGCQATENRFKDVSHRRRDLVRRQDDV